MEMHLGLQVSGVILHDFPMPHESDTSASDGQREGECTSLRGAPALSPNAPSMGFNEVLGNRQPDSAAAAC